MKFTKDELDDSVVKLLLEWEQLHDDALLAASFDDSDSKEEEEGMLMLARELGDLRYKLMRASLGFKRGELVDVEMTDREESLYEEAMRSFGERQAPPEGFH